MKFEHVFLIGTGGIGSNLVEPLVRMLVYHKDGTKNITLIDGDKYEEKNQTRQLFDTRFVGVNKAKATAQRIAEALIKVQVHEEYINKDKFIDLAHKTLNDTKAPFLVVTAVDNHATRKAIIEALDEGEFPNFVFLSGGNGYHNGQILVYAKIRGEAGNTHPFDKYDDLKYPVDHIPGDPGCQDDAPAEPQLITANAAAALGLLWTTQAMLDDAEWYEELHFDSVRMKLMPQGDPIKFPSLKEEAAAEKAVVETAAEKAVVETAAEKAVVETDEKVAVVSDETADETDEDGDVDETGDTEVVAESATV